MKHASDVVVRGVSASCLVHFCSRSLVRDRDPILAVQKRLSAAKGAEPQSEVERGGEVYRSISMEELRVKWLGIVEALKINNIVNVSNPENALEGALRIRFVQIPRASGNSYSASYTRVKMSFTGPSVKWRVGCSQSCQLEIDIGSTA